MPTEVPDPQNVQVNINASDVGAGTVTENEETETMAEAADLSPNVANQMLTQLMQTGTIAQNNFVTVQKAMDFDFMENKRMVTIDEAVGVREVASRESMQGKPSGTP